MTVKSVALAITAFVFVAAAQGVYKHYHPEQPAVVETPQVAPTPPPAVTPEPPKVPEQEQHAQKVPEQEQKPAPKPQEQQAQKEPDTIEVSPDDGIHEEIQGDNRYTAPKVRVHADKCRPEMDRLIAASPLARWTEAVMRAKGQEKFFRVWLDCEGKVISIATAVHESHHWLSEGAYQMANHVRIGRVEGIQPRPDQVIGPGLFPEGDGYVETYLKEGKYAATAHEDFDYLLDELNAYSVDIIVSMQLRDHLEADSSYRDGLAALMSMTMAYVNKVDVATLGQLTRYRRSMEALWSQAENHLALACQVKDFAHDDVFYRGFLSNPKNHAGLVKVLGRKLNLPTSCTPALVEQPGYQSVTN